MSSKDEVCIPAEEDDGAFLNPQEKLREKCKSTKECAALEKKLSTCNDRVNSRTKTAETCKEELIDFMHCVDHCVSQFKSVQEIVPVLEVKSKNPTIPYQVTPFQGEKNLDF